MINVMTENAKYVARKRIFQRDDNEEVTEDWEGLSKRVSSFIVSADQARYKDSDFEQNIENLLLERRFLFNSPLLRNAPDRGSFSACFVLEMQDSRESIFDILKLAVNIQAWGGGTGINFSGLRPRNSLINTTKGHSSGPVSFIEVFDLTIGDVIAQGGVRHGAQMGILDVNHPDILKFVNAKRLSRLEEEGRSRQLRNFNLSVAVTDEFMNMVVNDGSYDFPLEFAGKTHGTIKVKDLWDDIIYSSWATGCPGLFFIDKANENSPFDEKIRSTNPCGEQPLPPFGICNLGSLNIATYVKNKKFNFGAFEADVMLGIEALDNVIDLENYPDERIKLQAEKYRPVGLGIMGFHTTLIKMGIDYRSEEACKIAEQIGESMYAQAVRTSQLLGEEKGIPPALSAKGLKRRNAKLLTIAPTGTLSILAQCSGGIEPYFNWAMYQNRVMESRFIIEPIVEEMIGKEALQKLIDHYGTKEEDLEVLNKQIADALPQHICIAEDIDWKQHIRIQASWQKHIDAAVSKTVNISKDTPKQTIAEIYKYAYEKGCKGITAYRDGLYSNQPMSVGSHLRTKRPKELNGKTILEKAVIDGKAANIYITVNWRPDDTPYEVFLACDQELAPDTEALARTTSLALRWDIPIEKIVKQLSKVGSMFVIPILLAKALAPFIPENKRPKCPDCKATVKYEEGCVKCSANCGWGKC
jgi:ribonucleoside-diphosphate reductase alpha chain